MTSTQGRATLAPVDAENAVPYGAVPGEEFYYCLRHHTVEPLEGCPAIDRLGPYPDRATAERALEIVAERNRAEDAAEDAEWDGGT